MIGSSYPLLDIFWTMLEFFLFFIWIWIVIMVFMDIFRSHDLSGGAKFLWVLLVIIIPFLGVFIYLIVRGGSMQERANKEADSQQKQFDDYVRQQAAAASPAEELTRLTDLKAKGAISDEEFDKAKAKLLN